MEQIKDIELSKHYNGSDYLSWVYKGKIFWIQGDFYVDKNNMLHHSWTSPDGEDYDITTPYI